MAHALQQKMPDSISRSKVLICFTGRHPSSAKGQPDHLEERPAPWPQVVDTSQRYYTVSGLLPSRLYRFKVSIETSVAEGELSDPLEVLRGDGVASVLHSVGSFRVLSGACLRWFSAETA